ncbi:MAG: SufS family cysteine desulfurase [Magnetococcales bacterium]|nr:SufS family cysteine desulfurase [Magnetococcales bacterium]
MTTQTSTQHGVPGVTGGPPPGLPDEATLTRLASEFLAALPGTFVPDTVPSRVATAPAADAVATSAPDATASSNPLLGIPFQYIPALPQVDAVRTPVAVPSTPYYFLGEASPYHATAAEGVPAGGGHPAAASQHTPGVPSGNAAALPRTEGGRVPLVVPGSSHAPGHTSPPGKKVPDDRVVAQSYGLPGGQELLQVLRGVIGAGAPSQPQPGSASPGGNGFYFLDTQGADAVVPQAVVSGHPPFDVNAVRRDFPILAERVHGRPLIWFDNAATTQKPQAVIDRLAYFYAHENSNIHRAAHELAARATDAYEAARDKVARFLGAESARSIVFVRGATEAINLVAQSYGRQQIGAGDEILVSHLEHHANIVPWQQLAAEKGARLRVIPVDEDGQIVLDAYLRLLNDHTKLVAITQVSNALGTVTPVAEVIELAHRFGAHVLVDGAQAVSHMRVDVQALDADFYVFSGHKVLAPTGIGVLYGKPELLAVMPPWQGGGNMISDVTFEKTLYHDAPARFEAGTGNIADAVGLGAAIDYLQRLGMENVARYEHGLLGYATDALRGVPGLRLIGTARDKASVLSFVLDGHRTEEVGAALNREGIAVRSGHHCAQPILRRLGVESTVRPSLAFYNTCAEVDTLVAVLHRLARS